MESSASDDRLAEMIARRNDSTSDFHAARKACAALYRRHAPGLLIFLSSRVSRPDLEDAHQTVWERVWRSLPVSYRSGNFRAWIFQIAKNYLVDCSRRKKTETYDEPDAWIDESVMSPDRQAEENERMAGLKLCLEQLEETMRRVVRGRLSGEAYQQISDSAGLEPAQAHKLFHVGKRLLQDCVRNRYA